MEKKQAPTHGARRDWNGKSLLRRQRRISNVRQSSWKRPTNIPIWRRKLAEHAVAPHDHAHQFDDREQQAEAVSLGMWAFLVQEILFFGGLFMSYTVYRSYYPQAFVEGSHHLDILLGGFNTVVLIASSLTMAMAVYSAQNSRRAQLVFFLLATLFLGSVFLGV